MRRVAFLGPEGTVSQEAAVYFFQDGLYEFVPYKWISDVFSAAASGEADISVIPIENTIDGSVHPHVDMLVHDVDLPILAEWVYPSIQNLIGLAGEEEGESVFSSIRYILSMPVAIAQCQQFLKARLPGVEFIHVSSTAEGVRMVREKGDARYAAIGTVLAAEKYGLKVLARNITDHSNNFTRFIAIGKNPPEFPDSAAWKTTILVTLPEDYPGALHQVLSAFAWRRINLTKIESRPTKKKLGSYYFYIDIEGALESVLLPAAISEIEAIGCQVRILGSYPSYAYKSTHSSN